MQLFFQMPWLQYTGLQAISWLPLLFRGLRHSLLTQDTSQEAKCRPVRRLCSRKVHIDQQSP